MAFSAARKVSATNSSRLRARTAASTCVLSVRWRPRALSSPASCATSNMRASKRSLASPASNRGGHLADPVVGKADVAEARGEHILPVDRAQPRLAPLPIAQALAEL